MGLVIFTRRTHDDPAPRVLKSDDWLLDPHGELNRIEPELLARPRVGERSCCCAGPARVRVILPVPGPDNGMVDILLCNHHYRISAMRLTELGALCINAPAGARNAPSPVGPLPGPRQRT